MSKSLHLISLVQKKQMNEKKIQCQGSTVYVVSCFEICLAYDHACIQCNFDVYVKIFFSNQPLTIFF